MCREKQTSNIVGIKQIEDRRQRLQWATDQNNTTDAWRLLVAAVESAFVKFFRLDGKKAMAMIGRGMVRIPTQKKRNQSPRMHGRTELILG